MKIAVLVALLAAASTTALWLARVGSFPARVAEPASEANSVGETPRLSARAESRPLRTDWVPGGQLGPSPQSAGPYQPEMRYDPVAAAAIQQQARVIGMEPLEIAKLQQQQKQLDPTRIAIHERRHQEAKEWKRQHPAGGSRP